MKLHLGMDWTEAYEGGDMTDIATEFLDHYLADDTQSRFAVMIEGPWGAGKTWFVKRYLRARAAKRKKAETRP